MVCPTNGHGMDGDGSDDHGTDDHGIDGHVTVEGDERSTR